MRLAFFPGVVEFFAAFALQLPLRRGQRSEEVCRTARHNHSSVAGCACSCAPTVRVTNTSTSSTDSATTSSSSDGEGGILAHVNATLHFYINRRVPSATPPTHPAVKVQRLSTSAHAQVIQFRNSTPGCAVIVSVPCVGVYVFALICCAPRPYTLESRAKGRHNLFIAIPKDFKLCQLSYAMICLPGIPFIYYTYYRYICI